LRAWCSLLRLGNHKNGCIMRALSPIAASQAIASAGNFAGIPQTLTPLPLDPHPALREQLELPA
jgi:hypothetical protein